MVKGATAHAGGAGVGRGGGALDLIVIIAYCGGG